MKKLDQTILRNWDANIFWDEKTACNECKSDDLREDHAGDCDCYCHLPAKVKFLESQLALAREGLESIAKNSCCEPCREAGLVAQQTLAKLGKENK